MPNRGVVPDIEVPVEWALKRAPAALNRTERLAVAATLGGIGFAEVASEQAIFTCV